MARSSTWTRLSSASTWSVRAAARHTREALGIGKRKAQALVRLSRALRSRPVLRAATLAGEVRLRHAETILPVAVGEAEARWVERARGEPENLVAVCAYHHLRGIHGGYLRLWGRAPDGLVWEVGPRDAPVDLRSRCGGRAVRDGEACAA